MNIHFQCVSQLPNVRHTKNSHEVRQQSAGGNSGKIFTTGVGQSISISPGSVSELHVSPEKTHSKKNLYSTLSFLSLILYDTVCTRSVRMTYWAGTTEDFFTLDHSRNYLLCVRVV